MISKKDLLKDSKNKVRYFKFIIDENIICAVCNKKRFLVATFKTKVMSFNVCIDCLKVRTLKLKKDHPLRPAYQQALKILVKYNNKEFTELDNLIDKTNTKSKKYKEKLDND